VPSLNEGDRVQDTYEIRQYLGQGTLGETYLVRHLSRNQMGVLKFLPRPFSQQIEIVRNFLNYYRSRRKLSLKHSAEIIDLGVEEGTPFIVIQFLEGIHLGTLISAKIQSRTQFQWEEGASLLLEIGDALLELHKHSFVHGALKPSNIFIQPDRVYLTDDGYPVYLPIPEFVHRYTSLPHSASFLPPELYVGTPPSPKGDLYSLASIAIFLFTGEEFSGEILLKKKREDLPPALEEVLRKGLHENPDERYETVGEFLLKVAEILNNRSLVEKYRRIQEEGKKKEEKKPTAPPPPPATPKPTPPIFEEEITLYEQPKPQPPPTPSPPQLPSKKPPSRLLILGISTGAILLLSLGGILLLRRPAPPPPEPTPQAVKKVDPNLYGVTRNLLKKIESRIQEEEKYSGVVTLETAKIYLKEAKEKFSKEDLTEALLLAQKAETQLETFQKWKSSVEEEEKRRKTEGEKEKPSPLVSERKTEKSCPKGMVLISGGRYRVGAEETDPYKDPLFDRPAQTVKINDFCIDLYEFPNQKGKVPLSGVSYETAEKECEKTGKRLCTEEEWEVACSGKRGNLFPYGKEWNQRACLTDLFPEKGGSPKPSGSLPQCVSEFGVYDQSGNLLEWTSTSFEKDPKRKIMKGGSYRRSDYASRCPFRYPSLPGGKDPEFGFRCCADPR
jgi:serine/threonine protein kinase/formylglycine-generating enzyme required for sulfatase activity